MGEEAGGFVLAGTAAIETGAIEGTATGDRSETGGVGASGEPPPSALRA